MQSRKKNPAILSRGYGRRSKGFSLVSDGRSILVPAKDAGDEPSQLADHLKNAVVAVGEKRTTAAKRVLADSSADSIVLDDGFQHRYLHRDLDLVLMTTREIFENGWLLPAGKRRETMASLRRADAVIISKCKDVREYELAKEKMPEWIADKVAGFRLVPKSLRNVSGGKSIDLGSVMGTPVMIFSGLGDPRSFKRSVEECGCVVARGIEFRDHHWYSESDLKRLDHEFRDSKAKFAITTEKDLVRLRSLENWEKRLPDRSWLHVLEIGIEFVAREDMIDGLIERVMK